jgi:hypothetical protein
MESVGSLIRFGLKAYQLRNRHRFASFLVGPRGVVSPDIRNYSAISLLVVSEWSGALQLRKLWPIRWPLVAYSRHPFLRRWQQTGWPPCCDG